MSENPIKNNIPVNQIQINPASLRKVAIVAFVLLGAYSYYFFMPVLSLKFAGIYVLVSILSAIASACFSKPIIQKVLIWIAMLSMTAMIIIGIFSGGLFRSQAHKNLLGGMKETSFSDLISPIDLTQIPIVDPAFAISLAEKKLGDDYALGSRVVLGKATRQMVNGKLYFAIPLLHSGFYKWLSNQKEGTPGYIIVSATNPQDIRFIREINGKPIKMRYQPNSFFGQYLKRKIYFSGIQADGIADYSFEIDEDFRPWWVATIYQHKIGISGADAIGTAIVNPETGAVKYYSVQNTPKWVDRIQPSELVMSQLNNWGQYVHGFWNTWFGKRDMLQTTAGYNVVYGIDNKCYYYTGITSVGADEGAVGFALVNTRSKKAHFYRISGATEYAAMRSAEGKVQNYKYEAVFPILINVAQRPTFFMTLKDSAGLVKMFAMVSVKDFSIVGVGETVKSARDSYVNALSMQRNTGISNDSNEKIKVSSSISRLGTDMKDGRTFYYIVLTAKPNTIFVVNTDLSDELPVTKEGDIVEVEYLPSEEKTINLLSFKNPRFEKKSVVNETIK